jgi:hypothetical protein
MDSGSTQMYVEHRGFLTRRVGHARGHLGPLHSGWSSCVLLFLAFLLVDIGMIPLLTEGSTRRG